MTRPMFVLLLATLLLGFAPLSYAAEPPPAVALHEALATPYAAPEFAGLTDWRNSAPLTMAELKGKVVLVDFWAYSCVNCVRTLPQLIRWDQQYRDKGLVIIGIHAPEFDFERVPANVAAAIQKRGITYPVALDNGLASWAAFHNQYWPAHYLIDRQGRVVYTHFGEGKYDVTEHNIRALLGLRGDAAAGDNDKPYSAGQTPETYLGYARAQTYAGMPVQLPQDTTSRFTHPTSALALHQWSLGGQWHVAPQQLTAEEKGASLRLHFHARRVYAVLGSRGGKPLHVAIRLNGKPLGALAGRDAHEGLVSVDHHTLYELLDLGHVGEGEITLTADAPGLEAYTFTFGS